MLYIGLFVLCLVVGLIFEIMAFTEPDFTMASRIFAVICGLIFLAIPMFVIFTAGTELIALLKSKLKRNDSGEKVNSDLVDFVKDAVKDDVSELAVNREEKALEDETALQKFLTRFRKDYSVFFERIGSFENTPLQFDATQLYWNILSMQKNRLDSKNMTMKFTAKRKVYNGIEPISEKQYFDGKYEVNEISESVVVEQSFCKGTNTLFAKTMNRVAHFVVTSAKQVGAKEIICPNCGAKTSRENLIDGCDYCGTKFSVQDLENKVSAFRLRDDYEIQYEKYRNARRKYNQIVFWGQSVVYFVIMMIVYFSDFGSVVESAGNVALALLFIPLTSAIGAGMFAFLGLCFFWFCIFPFIQIGKSAQFYSKRRLDEMKRRYQQDTKSEAQIRKQDPQFSVAAFYTELTNKLACIHFANTRAGSNAFLETDRDDLVDRYSNVVDMDIEDINVRGYMIHDGVQEIKVKVNTSLLEDKDNRLKKRKETLNLALVRMEDVKTQAICGPSVFRCKGCGASIALENGKTCNYCGNVFDFKQFDWVIRDYQIK